MILDSAPFSFLAIACAMTNPVWLACVVSFFVRSKPLRMITGGVTALAGAFIITMGVTSTIVGNYRAEAVAQHAEASQVNFLIAAGRAQAEASLLFVPVGALPLLLGCIALVLGARTPPAEKKA